jgi:hypothetical protein
MNHKVHKALLLVTIALAGVWLFGAPESQAHTLLQDLRALAAAAAWSFLAHQVGARVLGRFWRNPPDGPIAVTAALILGWYLLGCVTATLGILGLYSPLISVFVAASLLPLLRGPIQGLESLRQIPPWSFWIPVGIGLLPALCPPTDTDSLYQFLNLAGRLIREGTLPGGFFHPDGSRPSALIAFYSLPLTTGGPSAPGLCHLLLTGLLVPSTAQLAAKEAPSLGLTPEATSLAALLLLVPSWSFLSELHLPANNLPVAASLLVAFEAGRRGGWLPLATFLGISFTYKYTALGGALLVLFTARQALTQRAFALSLALFMLSPWALRTLVQGLHPLFPYAGWPEVAGYPLGFQHLEKYGAGREPIDFLMLPWNLFFSAERNSFRFLGQLNPALLPAIVLSPTLLFRREARWLPVGLALAAAIWAIGPQWIRHLLPILPLMALIGALAWGSSLGRFAPAAIFLFGLAGAPRNVIPTLEHLALRAPVATGRISRDAWLSESVPAWPILRVANRELPPDARVALLYVWEGALLDRSQIFGSVEDHIPVRHFLLTHGEQWPEALREAGITHLVVGPDPFVRRAWSWVEEPEWRATFMAPRTFLEEGLLQQAILQYETQGYRLYRLPTHKPLPAPLDALPSSG